VTIVHFDWLSLKDFRNYRFVEIALAKEGITLFIGANGAGKTNLLEAVGVLATWQSFRGAPPEAMVREGASQAVLRGQVSREGRSVLVEAELNRLGRGRLQLNHQAVRKLQDLRSALAVTVFSPDDLELVKGGPQHRREYLDDLLASFGPKYGAARSQMERALKQRNALLRAAKGALRGAMAMTMDVWDAKLAEAGEAVAQARQELVEALVPRVAAAYGRLSRWAPGSSGEAIGLQYQRSWQGGLLDALQAARPEDLRRAVTTLGPQRDDMVITLGGLPARLQASQGEQRSLALALRLAGHGLVTDQGGSRPVLLLDDVFSELDANRCAALAESLPLGQALLTATEPPAVSLPLAARARVAAGVIER